MRRIRVCLNDFIGTAAAFLDYAETMDHNAQNLWNVSSGWSWVINPTTVNQLTGQFLTWTHDQTYPTARSRPQADVFTSV